MLTVLGAAGFIGSNLTRRLLDRGETVRVVDITEPEWADRREVWDSAAERQVADLRDADSVARAVHGSEQVFHLAADVGGVGYLAAHDYRPYFNNMRMSMNILDACETLRVGRLFYASSSCIYPVDLQHPGTLVWLEEDRHVERGPSDLMYGREKLMTLHLCGRAPFDARVGIVNTVFGPGLKLDGERMKYPAAITGKVIRAAQSGQPVDVWGDGTQVRGYLHVDDAVTKILRIMTDPYAGPVNITSMEVASCDNVARMVMDIVGTEVPIHHVDGPTGPACRQVSNRKWELTYGPDPQRSMREAYEDFVAWVHTHL